MGKIRSVRGGAWAKLVHGEYTPSQQMLEHLGSTILECIVYEARRDLMRQQAMTEPGGPVGLPDSEKFFASFSYRVQNNNIEILCDWPNIQSLTEGRAPYPMSWLTQERGVGVVPLQGKNGEVIFRTAPHAGDVWIHPGYEKHTFIQRGVSKGRKKMLDLLKQDLITYLQGRV